MYEEIAALFEKETIDPRDLESEIEDLESEIEDLESEIEDLESEIEDLESEIEDLESEIEDLDNLNSDKLKANIEELKAKIKDLNDKKQTLTVDPIAKLWLASAKSFYEDAGCYHGSSLVSEYYIVDYFIDTVYEILDQCPECVREFVDKRAFADSMSNDLTVVEIKYPSQDGVVNTESWYLV